MDFPIRGFAEVEMSQYDAGDRSMEPSTPAKSSFKRIDQMLEDFAGDEVDDYSEPYADFEKSHKHYSADEDAMLDVDDLY